MSINHKRVDVLVNSDDNQRAIKALDACQNAEEINDIFTRFEITGNEEKVACLRSAMGAPKCYSSKNSLTAEEFVEYEISVFLSGKWRTANRLALRIG